MKTRVLSLFLLLSLLSGLLVAPLTAFAQADAKSASLPVTGTGTAPSGPVTFDGTFTIDKFDIVNGQLVAIGHLTGTVTETVTGTKTSVPDHDVTLPVQSINGS